MKKIKYLLFLLVLIPFLKINASGSVTVSTSGLSIDEGSTKTFTITANNAAGRIDISTTSLSVATVSKSSVFLDNNSVTITVNGKKHGIVDVVIKMIDVATYDGEVISGTKRINVNVSKPKTDTPVKKEPKRMSIYRFEIVGYPIDFEVNKKEYTIDVSNKVNDLYIIVEGKNFTAIGNKEVKIKDKNEIVVSLRDDVNTKDYTIKINRVSNKTGEDKKENVKTVIEYVENDINKTLVGISLFFVLLSIVLCVLVFKNKQRKTPDKEQDYKKDLLNMSNQSGENKPSQHINSNWKDSPFNEDKDNKKKYIADDAFSDIDVDLPNSDPITEDNLPQNNIINIDETSEEDNDTNIN